MVSNPTFYLNDSSILNSDQVAQGFGQSRLENLQGPGGKSALCSASRFMYIKAYTGKDVREREYSRQNQNRIQ